MSEIIISVKIWELKDGEITKIAINDTVYNLVKDDISIYREQPVEFTDEDIEKAEEADFQEHQNEYKKCTKCGETKPLSEFYERKKNKDGYHNQCKDCIKKYQRSYKKTNKPKQSYKDIIGGVKVLPDVLERIRKALLEDKHTNIKNIIREEYPNFTDEKTLSKYSWAYRRYLQDNEPDNFKNIVGKKGESRRNNRYPGKVIGHEGKTPIIDTVLKEFKEAVKNGRSPRMVIHKFFPTYKNNTKKGMVRTYARWIKKHSDENIDLKLKKTIKRKNHKRPLPSNAVGYCDTYQTYIKKDEYNKVLRSINTVEFNYHPTSQAIRNRAKIPKHRVGAILRYLQDEGIVKYRINEFGTPVYFSLNKVEKKEENDIKVLEALENGNFTIEELCKRLDLDNQKVRIELIKLRNNNKIEIVFNDEGHIVYKKL